MLSRLYPKAIRTVWCSPGPDVPSSSDSASMKFRGVRRGGAAARHPALHVSRGGRRLPRCAVSPSRSRTPAARPPRARSAKAICPPTPSSAANIVTSCSKEIHEQPRAIAQTLEERVAGARHSRRGFGPGAKDVFAGVEAVHIAACGTSYHAGLVASHFIEANLAGCRRGSKSPANIGIGIRWDPGYAVRHPVAVRRDGRHPRGNCRNAKRAGYRSTLTICNVAESSMVRNRNSCSSPGRAPEIGVASTKAFTTQLTALGMLVVALAKHRLRDAAHERDLVLQLLQLPGLVEKTLTLDETIRTLAETFADKAHALFVGRGPLHAIAMEGALKLKEISYIHAEAYAAAELKHGPLALVDEDMPVVAVAPNNDPSREAKVQSAGSTRRAAETRRVRRSRNGHGSSEGVTVIRMP